MNKNDKGKKEQFIYIFNNNKEDINMQIQKSFITYLRDRRCKWVLAIKLQ